MLALGLAVHPTAHAANLSNLFTPQTPGYLASSYHSFQPLTAFELVTELPGVMSTPSLLNQPELYIRGLAQKYSRILINGMPLSGTASQQYQLLRRIPASSF